VIKNREPVHTDGESVASAWPHQRLDAPFAGLMEKIMSKSNDSSKLGRATNELRDDELQKVSGGYTLEKL
jgi:bacteriocin-like protein